MKVLPVISYNSSNKNNTTNSNSKSKFSNSSYSPSFGILFTTLTVGGALVLLSHALKGVKLPKKKLPKTELPKIELPKK